MWIGLKRLEWKKSIVLRVEKYKKFVKSKISYVCYKTLLLSSIYKKCGSEDEKIFKEYVKIFKNIKNAWFN